VSGAGVPEPLVSPITGPADDLATVAASLRADWRADESEWMHEAARRWTHARGMGDVLVDYAARGDRVSIDVAGFTFEGAVTAVGDDRIDLDAHGALVTIRTALGGTGGKVAAPIVVRRTLRARRGGRRVPPALVTFAARLRELEVDARPVRLGLAFPPREMVGEVVVGADHVIVRGIDEAVIPLAWVAYVVASSDVPS